MVIIKSISKMIRCELDDAERYAKEYALNSDTEPRLADMFKRLASTELEHANILHAEAVRLIKEANREAPPSMKSVWDWEHELMLERTTSIKMMLN